MIPLSELKDRTRAEILRCAKIVRQEINIAKIRVNVSYHLRGKTVGMAYGTSKIALNGAMLQENSSEIEPTVAHEFSHLIVNMMYPDAKPHGIEWKSWMIAFGHIPHVTHKMAPATIHRERYVLMKCSCRNHYITHYRYKTILDGRLYYCNNCKRILRRG